MPASAAVCHLSHGFAPQEVQQWRGWDATALTCTAVHLTCWWDGHVIIRSKDVHVTIRIKYGHVTIRSKAGSLNTLKIYAIRPCHLRQWILRPHIACWSTVAACTSHSGSHLESFWGALPACLVRAVTEAERRAASTLFSPVVNALSRSLKASRQVRDVMHDYVWRHGRMYAYMHACKYQLTW